MGVPETGTPKGFLTDEAQRTITRRMFSWLLS